MITQCSFLQLANNFLEVMKDALVGSVALKRVIFP